MVGCWGHPHNLLCALTASAHKPSVKISTGDAGQLSAQVCGVGLYYELMGGPFWLPWLGQQRGEMASAAAELARSGLLKEIKAITILNVDSTPARL